MQEEQRITEQKTSSRLKFALAIIERYLIQTRSFEGQLSVARSQSYFDYSDENAFTFRQSADLSSAEKLSKKQTKVRSGEFDENTRLTIKKDELETKINLRYVGMVI